MPVTSRLPTSPHMFCNVPVASQSFKISDRLRKFRPDCAQRQHLLAQHIRFRAFIPVCSESGQPTLIFSSLESMDGTVQVNVSLTVGDHLCDLPGLGWHERSPDVLRQWCPPGHGACHGPHSQPRRSHRSGPFTAKTALIYTLGDYNAWDNYGLTQSDAQYLTNNGDPATVGTGRIVALSVDAGRHNRTSSGNR